MLYINFQSLEIVSRYREPQLLVTEKCANFYKKI